MKHRAYLRLFAQLYLRQRRWLAVAGIALASLTVLAGVGLLALSGWFIAATAVAGLTTATAMAFNIFGPSAGIRLLTLSRTAARYGERLVTHDATLAVLADLRGKLFLGWAKPQAARRLLSHPARLLFRLTTDIDALDSLYLRIAVPLASSVAVAVLAGLLLGVLDRGLGLFFGVWLLACSLLVAPWQARLARPSALRRTVLAERFRTHAIDLVSGQADLLMTGQLPRQQAALLREEAALARADDEHQRAEASGLFVQGMLSTLTVFLALLAVAWLMERGRIDVALATLCVLAVLAAFEPMAALRRGMLDWGRTQLALVRLAPRLGGEAPPVPHASDTSPSPSTVGHPAPLVDIRLRGCVFAQPGSATATLANLDLRIAAGERVALIGHSGAGKSTLLMALAGELPVLEGHDEMPPNTWLTQRTDLFHDSIRANLRLANRDADDAQLWQVLEQAGLGELQLPHGLDTLLGEGGLGLSAGQGRRLALARLLLRPVPVWLLDEPTEALDADTANALLDTLFALAGPRTVVMATHLRREARHADRLIELAGGRVTHDVRRGEPVFDLLLRSLRPD
ncbi:MAG: thiol reductant ABC exporter subunit CydC [Pigmentiphaga sp.]